MLHPLLVGATVDSGDANLPAHGERNMEIVSLSLPTHRRVGFTSDGSDLGLTRPMSSQVSRVVIVLTM